MTNPQIDRLRKAVERAHERVGGVSIERMGGDNLAVTLCSHFEDGEGDNDDYGWGEAATAGYEETVQAIRDHYQPVFDEYAAAINALLAKIAELEGERDEARIALNRGRRADEDCPIAAHLDDMYARSDDDQDKMHLAMAAYELRRGPFDHPDHFGCEIEADELRQQIESLLAERDAASARVRELEEALEPFANGSIDVSHTAVILGGDALTYLRRARLARGEG